MHGGSWGLVTDWLQGGTRHCRHRPHTSGAHPANYPLTGHADHATLLVLQLGPNLILEESGLLAVENAVDRLPPAPRVGWVPGLDQEVGLNIVEQATVVVLDLAQSAQEVSVYVVLTNVELSEHRKNWTAHNIRHELIRKMEY